VYFISGLGADRRAFSRIDLPPGYEAVYLDWIEPLKHESLSSYAERFSKLIDDPECVIIGLSFGGILASELSKILSPKKVIIISGITCSDELPWYFKWMGKIGMHKIVPVQLMKTATIFRNSRADDEARKMIRDFVQNTSPKFIRWSLNAIINWRHSERFSSLVHIHGSKDHLLPCRYVNADYVIKDGGHLMVLNKAAEINTVLFRLLEKIK